MEPLSLPLAAWLAGAVGLIGSGAWVARRQAGRAAPPPVPALAEAPAEGQIRRIELRMEAMESLQADFLGRIDSLGDDDAAERRLQAMASRILGLVRDKDASLDTALAGLDQLRARLRVLEQMGDLAETRGLFEEQGTRLEAMAARLAGIEAATPPFAELADRIARLYGQRDAMAETVFARLAPLEARQRELEATLSLRDPQPGLDRLAERLDALRLGQEAETASLRAAQEAGLGHLRAAQEAMADHLRAAQDAATDHLRAAQETATAGLGERLAARLDGLAATTEARLGALEAAGDPQAALAERLAALHAQKDAGLEAALGRFAPLETRLAALEAGLAARDPQAALDLLAERLDSLRAAQEAAASHLRAAQEAETAGLRAAQDATAESLRAGQAALEERLRLARETLAREMTAEALRAAQEAATALDGRVGGRLDGLAAAQAAGLAAAEARLDGLAAATEARLDGLSAATGARIDGLSAMAEARLAALEGAEDPGAAILERLAGLHAQRDAGLEAALGRLAPLEARLAEMERLLSAQDLRGLLDRLAADLAAADGRLAALEAAGADAEAEAARMQAQAIAAQLVAARTVAEETRLFANRLSLLEASLPRLSIAQALMMQALERQAAPQTAPAWPLAEGGADLPAPPHLAAVETPATEIWRQPRPVPVPKG